MRCTTTVAPRLIAVTARPRSASAMSVASEAPAAVATSSRVMKDTNAGWPRTPTSTTRTLCPRSSICRLRNRTSSPLVSSAPSTTTVAMALSLDDRDGAHRRSRGVDPFDRKHRQLETVAGQLIEVGHVFQVVILALAHDQVRFPELFAF